MKVLIARSTISSNGIMVSTSGSSGRLRLIGPYLQSALPMHFL
jgi:hypothetical protein